MLRALIVDDDPQMRLLVRLVLETDDVAVTAEASSGPAALSALAAERPDVVVLDNMMPGMSGLDVARQALAADPALPIVLFSAALDERVLAEAAALGIRRCLPKTEVDRLVHTLREAAAGA